jgi:hypothetical protein
VLQVESNQLGGPPPAPKLDRRLWIRAGVGVGLLTVLLAVAAWFSLGVGHPTSPIYGGGTAQARTWTWDGSDFMAQPLQTDAGPNSSESEMAYDKGHQVVVLWDHGCSRLVMGFTGGCQSQVNQTWSWDGRTWIPHRSNSSPTVSGQGAMLYAGRLGQVIYVNRDGEAWAWSGSAWRAIAMSGAPRLAHPGSQDNPATSLVAVGYDEARDLLVLALPETTWTWNGQSWSRLSGGIDAADAQSDPHAVYDVAHGQLVYLGARSLWMWNGSRWAAQPQPNLAGGTLGYDSVRKNLVVVRQDAAACDSSACRAKVWTWDGTAWSTPPATHQPALPLTRSGAANPPMVFDEARGVAVLFVSAA